MIIILYNRRKKSGSYRTALFFCKLEKADIKSGNSFEKFSAVDGRYGEVDDVKIGFCFEACFGNGGGDACAIVGRCGGGAEKDVLQVLVLLFLFLFWGCLWVMEHNCPPFWNTVRAVDKSGAF